MFFKCEDNIEEAFLACKTDVASHQCAIEKKQQPNTYRMHEIRTAVAFTSEREREAKEGYCTEPASYHHGFFLLSSPRKTVTHSL